MTKKEKMAVLISRLKEIYPDARCALEYAGDPWRLLVMGRLSAQCTDKRVNEVCKELFRVLPDIASMANAPVSQIEELIRPCGLYRTKARNIKDAAEMLIEEFDGKIPENMDDLLRLPGVGRKIANLLLGDLFGKPAIVADTHCIRLSGRLGFVPQGEDNPYRVEMALSEITPPEESSDLCHRLVNFGRDRCRARNPVCDGCPIEDLCESKERK